MTETETGKQPHSIHQLLLEARTRKRPPIENAASPAPNYRAPAEVNPQCFTNARTPYAAPLADDRCPIQNNAIDAIHAGHHLVTRADLLCSIGLTVYELSEVFARDHPVRNLRCGTRKSLFIIGLHVSELFLAGGVAPFAYTTASPVPIHSGSFLWLRLFEWYHPHTRRPE